MASKHTLFRLNLFHNDYKRALQQGTIDSNMTLDQYVDVQLAESDGNSDLSKGSKGAEPSQTSASDATYGISNKPASFEETVEDLRRLSEKLEVNTTTTPLEKPNINLGNAVETKLDLIAEFGKRSELLPTPVKSEMTEEQIRSSQAKVSQSVTDSKKGTSPTPEAKRGMTEQEIRASQANVGQAFAESKKETPPTPEIKPGLTELEVRASQYWGTLATNTNISLRCSSFVVALCDFVCAISDAHSPAIPVSNAAAYLMPEHFSLVMHMFGFEEPVFGPAEVVQRFGHNFFDGCFAQYYLAFQVPIFWTTRPGSGHQNKLPLITRAAMKGWVWNFLRAYPHVMHKRINEILNEMGDVLRDPISEELFEYKFVPRTCVPAFFNQDLESLYAKAYTQYRAATDQLIANAKPEETPERTMQRNMQMNQLKMQMNMNTNMLALQAAANMAKIQKRGNLLMNGGWTKDEWGNDKYVESSVW